MNWFDIFKTGTHVDASGREITVTQADIDAVASAYNPTHHEAPIVIGHPKTDAPAFGWVEALRVDGDRLQAKPKQVEPQFKAMVDAGRFKKVSAKFSMSDAGLALRHVGFLGAQPPAVKGLRPVQFSDAGGPAVEFVQDLSQEDDMALQAAIDALRQQVETLAKTVEGLKPASGEADPKIKELEGQLAEMRAGLKKMEDDKAASEAAFAEAEKGRQAKARQDRFEALVQAGKALPGDREKVLAFAEACETKGELEFSEADGKVKKPLADAFWGFLEKGESHGLFREFSAPAEGAKPGESVNLASKF